ncbi:ATPase [Planctomicrobium sp. SH661]|uniref:ATPase n=1 Tax=Planctomicrobium sp. SH661 TaxID=3448124 RepID=UPI003F5C6489
MSYGPLDSRSDELSSPEDFTSIPEAVDLPEDVYERIVQQVRDLRDAINSQPQDFPPVDTHDPVEAPRAPASLEAAGISLGQLSDLVLKLLYLNGTLTGFEISRQVRLPFSVLSETMQSLKGDRSVEVSSGEMVGPLSYRYLLTEQGRVRAREAFETCRYVGPAPVSLEHYTRQCRLQSIKNVPLHEGELAAALHDLVLDPDLLRRLGPAVCSGQSIFLYGPPGNGKTVIAKGLGRWLNECGGAIHVPYAFSVDNQIVAVFDPSIHRPVNSSPLDEEAPSISSSHDFEPDLRWRQVRRPVVVAGGELNLEMLDLRFHPASGYYTAPLHVKANGGVFLLDDFGRQLVPAPQLLNRWILPLEDKTDALTLSTGKKFTVPFEQLTIFSTNLRPEELVDASFLRRIRHKLEIGYPSEKQYREIFRHTCEQRNIKYDDWIVSRLLTTQYGPETPPKASDPRDLLDVIEAICRFRGDRPHLSEKIVFEAFQECLGGPRLPH